MPGDDPEDERAGGPPPDPSDRVWVHPSEMMAFVARDRPASGRRARWAALAVGVGVVASVAVVALAVNLGDSARSVRPAAHSTVVQRIASAVAPSVVAIRLTRGDQTGRASGVCVQPGQVVTSAHALEGVSAISVVTADGHVLPATEVGRDPVSDLALLAVDEANTRPAKLGASAELSIGQQVIGVASSASGQRWVDVGEIGSFNRAFVWGQGVAVPGLLETDVTASEEHSGGALVDSQGAVVGILVVPPDASTAGLSLPIDQAREVSAQLLAGGRARHGWLGVLATDATDRAGGGARVQGVVTGSPADRAGLAQGDVLVDFRIGNSTTAIASMPQLMAEIGRRKPGEKLELSLYREGGKRHVAVRLGDQMDAESTTSAAAPGNAP
ncbi:MAG TPA: trypsin-like peptidase domain-containing protein [Acidimicrobiia bacterium]|jgi:S1-C subfamily serine protease